MITENCIRLLVIVVCNYNPLYLQQGCPPEPGPGTPPRGQAAEHQLGVRGGDLHGPRDQAHEELGRLSAPQTVHGNDAAFFMLCYVALLCGFVVWLCCVGLLCGLVVWACCVGLLCGLVVRACCVALLCSLVVWPCCVALLCGLVVWLCCVAVVALL